MIDKEATQGNHGFCSAEQMPTPVGGLFYLVARRALFPTVRISSAPYQFLSLDPKGNPFSFKYFTRVSHIRDLVPMPAMQARVLPVQLTRRTLANTSPVTGPLISLQGVSLV